MKRKSKLCSTGHGTGVIQEVSLGDRLQRDKEALLWKQYRRAEKHPHTLPSFKVIKMIREAKAAEEALSKLKEKEIQGFNIS